MFLTQFIDFDQDVHCEQDKICYMGDSIFRRILHGNITRV